MQQPASQTLVCLVHYKLLHTVKTHSAGLAPVQVDIVIVSCSCYAPTPSMAACLVNRFRMRPDVLTYHLAGMGCSSSLVCVDMAKRLLQARRGHWPAQSPLVTIRCNQCISASK